jgi:hypothetical protein
MNDVVVYGTDSPAYRVPGPQSSAPPPPAGDGADARAALREAAQAGRQGAAEGSRRLDWYGIIDDDINEAPTERMPAEEGRVRGSQVPASMQSGRVRRRPMQALRATVLKRQATAGYSTPNGEPSIRAVSRIMRSDDRGLPTGMRPPKRSRPDSSALFKAVEEQLQQVRSDGGGDTGDGEVQEQQATAASQPF